MDGDRLEEIILSLARFTTTHCMHTRHEHLSTASPTTSLGANMAATIAGMDKTTTSMVTSISDP